MYNMGGFDPIVVQMNADQLGDWAFSLPLEKEVNKHILVFIHSFTSHAAQLVRTTNSSLYFVSVSHRTDNAACTS